MNATRTPSTAPAVPARVWFLVVVLFLSNPWLACQPPPIPEIPIPTTLFQLDPQLKAHIEAQLQTVRAKPRDSARHATLGLIYAANDLWVWARPAFSNVVMLAPDEPLAQLYVGVAAQEVGDLEDALATYRGVTERFPQFGPGWFRLGELASKQGLLEEAERAFAKLVVLAPQEWRGPAGLGDVAFRNGKFTNALEHLERALVLEPQAGSVHHVYAQVLQTLGRTNEASWHRSMAQGVAGTPMPDDWSRQAVSHMKALSDQFEIAEDMAASGNPMGGVELLREALRFHPDDAAVLNQLAIACNRAGHPEQALAVLGPLLSKQPDFLAGWITRSFSEAQAERFSDALASANRALALSTNVAQPYLARANALLGMERDQDAVFTFLEAARIDPRNAQILLELVDVLWRNLSRGPEALGYARKAFELNPSLPEVHARLIPLETQFGDPTAAQRSREWLNRLTSGSRPQRAPASISKP